MTLRSAAVALACACTPPAFAQVDDAVPLPPADVSRWEGALGLTASYSPAYSGATQSRLKAHPGFFLRYGRFTITNASGFVTRRADDVMRGLGVDLARSDRLRLNLALRYDGGRSEGSADALKGLGDIKPTLRARASASYRLDDGWRVGASWSVDAFGRGGGNFGDVNVGRDHRGSPQTTWGWSVSVAAAGDRYLQSYYGITPEQSARSGYAVYEPGSGLRDVGASLSMRTELSPRWTALAGVGASRLVGPAAKSPLVTRPFGWGASAGLAWRF